MLTRGHLLSAMAIHKGATNQIPYEQKARKINDGALHDVYNFDEQRRS